MNISRIFWILFYRILFLFNNISYGKHLRICNSIYFRKHNSSSLLIGNNFSFSSGNGYNPLARNIKGSLILENDAKISIMNNVGISSCCIWIFESLILHDGVKIGADCILLDSDAHSLDFMERRLGKTDRPNAKKSGIVINEDVLVGTRCIILKGVTIGARSIIGSGSVVTRDIPSDEIWGGNPVKFIKKINN